MTRRTAVVARVDYERDGKQVGTLDLPYSAHLEAWSVVPIPIAVIKHGTGPTVLLMGGNHGDEYEGPIVLGRLIRELDPGRIRGRLIVVPALNQPAVRAATRTSPLDGKNLNRSFPGDPEGTTTSQIAHYVDSVLYAMADAVLDLHSGGSALEMVPSAIVEEADDPAHTRRNTEAVLAFDAPLAVVLNNMGEPRTSTAAAVRRGLTVVGTELGGSGAVSIEGVRVCERGVMRVLAHLGVMEPVEPATPPRTRLIRVPGPDGYVYAPAEGVFEPFHALGAEVEAGQPAGAVHFLDEPARPPEVAHFRTGGVLFSRRAPGRVLKGSCVGVVGVDHAP